VEDESGATQKVLGWVVLGLIFAQCAFNIMVQVKDQWLKVRMGWGRVKRCRQGEWQQHSVKMMTESQNQMDMSKMVGEEVRELKKQRKGSEIELYATGKDWKGATK
jgi:hypothetical protein